MRLDYRSDCFRLSFTFTLIFLLQVASVFAQVQGKVYRDFNGNGVFDSTAIYKDVGLSGVTVMAYDATGASVGSTTTNTTGNYTIAAVTGAVRIEFTGFDSNDYSGPKGADNGTSVQFVTAPATAVNYGVHYPQDYWDSANQPIPELLLPCYVSGYYNAANGPEVAIVRFGNDQNGLSPTKNAVATHAQVGTVWGNAYQRTNDRFFFPAFLKRHSGFGPRGIGGVYIVEKVSGNYGLAGSFSLQGVIPSNSATAIDLGSVTRTTTVGNDNYLNNSPTNKVEPSRDLDAFGKVGKVSWGGADIDESNKTLYLVNLNQRQIVTLDISGSTGSLDGASAATLSPLTNVYNIMSMPGLPSCTGGDFRPWGIKIYKGKGYLTGVCNANNGGTRDVNNLRGYVLSFDPANISAGFTTVLNINLKYPAPQRFNPWADTWAQTGLPTGGVAPGITHTYYQPIISDIEFDEKGGMTIAIFDRFGHQIGYENYIPVSGSVITDSGGGYGDILYACYNATTQTWTMEGSGGCPATNAASGEGYSGAGMFEYYNDTSGDNALDDGMGGLGKIMGTDKMISVVVDPHPVGASGASYWNTGGIHWRSVSTGTWSQYAQIYDNSFYFAGKAHGLGDVEVALSPAPIEIGNRIWADSDSDGIQDAGEPGIGNVTIELYADFDNNGTPDGSALATTSTTSSGTLGSWFFNTTNVTDGDPGTAGNQAGPQPGKRYLIRIGSADWSGGLGIGDLVGLQLTTTNSDVTTNGDLRDNDASLSGNVPTISYEVGEVGENDHTLDFGFKTCISPSAIVFSQTPATCTGATANNNGSITLVSATNADKWGISTINAGTYDGNNYAAATVYSANTVVQTNMPNTGGTYILRLFNGADGCYKDTTIQVSQVFCFVQAPIACGMRIDSLSAYQNSNVHGRVSSMQSASVLLGGERDMNFVPNVPASQTNTSFEVGPYFSGGTALDIANQAAASSTLTVQWDGIDNDPVTLNATGLGGLNFSALNIDRIKAELLADFPSITNDSLPIRFELYTNSGAASRIQKNFKFPSNTLNIIEFEFSQLVPFIGAGVDLSDIGAVVMYIDMGPNAVSTRTGWDVFLRDISLECAVCTQPTSIVTTQTPATCTGPTANNNGTITLTTGTNGTHVGVSSLNAGSYDGPAFASATAIALPQLAQSIVPNTGGTYIVRVYNGSDSCYTDETVTVSAVTCSCPTINCGSATIQRM